MSLNTDLFKSVLQGAQETFESLGFSLEKDESGNYITEAENGLITFYSGEKGAVKLIYADERLTVFCGSSVDDADTRLMLSLLPNNASAKDISYSTNELCEALNSRFAEKTFFPKKAAQNSKMPQTVSKAAVKNGSFYDPITLASKLCLVFPEIRDEYKANVSHYGEFMAEDFFQNHAAPRVVETIKGNQPAKMKKLFQILNEIYEDGTNDTQGVIAVTLLGQLNNDQILLARAVDYMSETMAPPVIEVNKFLATSAGKKAQKKLADPPAYKPKKKKKGLMDRMMSQQQGLNQQ